VSEAPILVAGFGFRWGASLAMLRQCCTQRGKAGAPAEAKTGDEDGGFAHSVTLHCTMG